MKKIFFIVFVLLGLQITMLSANTDDSTNVPLLNSPISPLSSTPQQVEPQPTLRTRVWKIPGEYSWTVPNGVTQISLKVIGGGGGGNRACMRIRFRSIISCSPHKIYSGGFSKVRFPSQGWTTIKANRGGLGFKELGDDFYLNPTNGETLELNFRVQSAESIQIEVGAGGEGQSYPATTNGTGRAGNNDTGTGGDSGSVTVKYSI